MVKAYLSLGSNLGDRLNHLRSAIKHLSQQEEITVNQISPVYETLPWGLKDQSNFYNLALEIITTCSPDELLTFCQRIEHQLDRTREVRWGPRTIDIDILLYGDQTISSETLQIPHPLMCERDFVLVPLNDIAPRLNVAGVAIREHLHQLAGENSPPKLITEIIHE